MTRRNLERRVSDLEDGAPREITLKDAYRWIRDLRDSEDVGRPPAYFGHEDYSEQLLEQHGLLSERDPALGDLTPPEAFALGYMDDETRRHVAELVERERGEP
ncbi:hypothetical protein [Natronococcus sp.]|uniref:hypothetical protein n=1 Tax=Natronococcus sp. TaxID=35747 RepID=UPI003A4E1CD9